MLNLLETAMAALAAGLTSIVFFKVEFFGVGVPLIVLWLGYGRGLLHGLFQLHQHPRFCHGNKITHSKAQI